MSSSLFSQAYHFLCSGAFEVHLSGTVGVITAARRKVAALGRSEKMSLEATVNCDIISVELQAESNLRSVYASFCGVWKLYNKELDFNQHYFISFL